MKYRLQLPDGTYKQITLSPREEPLRREVIRVGGSCRAWWILDPGFDALDVGGLYSSDYFFVNTFYGDEMYHAIRQHWPDTKNIVIQIFAGWEIDVREITDEERNFFVTLSRSLSVDDDWIEIEPMIIPRTNNMQVFTESGAHVYTCEDTPLAINPQYLDIVARSRGWTRQDEWTLYANKKNPTRKNVRVDVRGEPYGSLMPGLIEVS